MRVTREQESFSFVAAADSGAVCRPTLRDDSPRGMKSGGTGHGGRENCGGRRTSSRFIVVGTDGILRPAAVESRQKCVGTPRNIFVSVLLFFNFQNFRTENTPPNDQTTGKL